MADSPITSPLRESDREPTAKVLQATLVDLVDLTLVAKQAHWNVVGRHFRNVHLHLDELVDAARRFTDDVAERSAAIGAPPDGRAATVSANSGLPDYAEGWQTDEATVDAIIEALDELVQRLRERIDETDKGDLVTQDLFIEIAAELEKQRWMWQAQKS